MSLIVASWLGEIDAVCRCNEIFWTLSRGGVKVCELNQRSWSLSVPLRVTDDGMISLLSSQTWLAHTQNVLFRHTHRESFLYPTHESNFWSWWESTRYNNPTRLNALKIAFHNIPKPVSRMSC